VRRPVFNSVPEALTYFLLILLIGFNVLLLVIQNHNTQQIEQQQNCIAAFFLKPNRTGLTLTQIGVCGDVINGIDHTDTK
jgi:hypothetical protein